MRRLCIPQTQEVDPVRAVAADEHITRESANGGIVFYSRCAATVIVPVFLDNTAKAHLNRVIVAGNKPVVAGNIPFIRAFDLLAVYNLLSEHTKLIAERITGDGQVERSCAVCVAGGKTTQAAVSESRVRLCLKNIGRLEAKLLYGSPKLVEYVEVESVFSQRAPHKKLH